MGKRRRAPLRRKLFLITTCLLVIGLGIGITVAFQNPFLRYLLKPEFRQEVVRYAAILFAMDKYYLEEENVDFHKLTDEALIGMAESLDPYSKFVPDESFQNYTESERLGYSGAGFRSRNIEGKHWVVRVFPGSPAQKAGLKVGDQVVTIDGEKTSSWTSNEFSNRIQGTVDNEVTIGVDGPDGKRTLPMARAKIRPKAVDDFWVNSQRLGYLRITKFTEYVGAEMENRLPKMIRKEMRGLVLDLRDNGGGEMRSTVDVASFFLPENSLIASWESRTPEMNQEFHTSAKKVSLEIPLIILINERSASGSECLAGALQHYGRAKLVGMTTYGKGTVQNMIQLSDGSILKMTMARYNLPDGTNVEKVGVKPDHEVALPKEDEEQWQMQRDLVGEFNPKKFTSLFGLEPVPDPQMEKAMTLLREAVGESP